MKPLLFGAIVGALLCTPALAQPQTQQQRGGDNVNFGAQNGAVLQLPAGVQNVVSIDAHNLILIASDGEQPGETRYTPTRIKHVYSGGIARLFGGFSVPTAQFVTPGAFNDGNNNNQNGGVATVGGNNNNGFGNNGFGGANQNNNGGFQQNGGFGGGFLTGALRGQGFDTLRRNDIINARVRAR